MRDYRVEVGAAQPARSRVSRQPTCHPFQGQERRRGEKQQGRHEERRKADKVKATTRNKVRGKERSRQVAASEQGFCTGQRRGAGLTPQLAGGRHLEARSTPGSQFL